MNAHDRDSAHTESLSGDELTVRSERSLDQYFKDRVERKIIRYDEKAKRFKWFYWVLAIVSTVSAAIVPVLINDAPDAATIVSLIVTITVGLQGIFHPREHWRNYDLITAALREEEMLFSTGAGEYANVGDKTRRFKMLVQRVESHIAKERAETITMRTSAPPGKSGGDNGNDDDENKNKETKDEHKKG